MMRFDVIMQQLVVVALVAVIVASAKPAEEEKKSRVIKDTLSDEPHYVSDEHNPDYDHEAFLGEDEARTFDQLTPEESKLRLGKIVDRIDQDSDGFVTLEELKGWIDYTQKRYIADDVQRQWNAHNPKNKPELDWEEYRQMVYGFLDNMDPTDLENDEEGMSYKDMLKRDHRRWKIADENEDNMLDIKEFTNFLHPEEAGHMRDIVVLETMEDIDKDKNGKISLDEYIGDMYKGEEGEEEPSWVSSEREQFSQYRDKDSDGFMDTEEVKAWIIPPDYDHSQAEASHLLHESDMNEDQKLSKTEILNKYDLFVGSQATDFGEALVRHDEF